MKERESKIELLSAIISILAVIISCGAWLFPVKGIYSSNAYLTVTIVIFILITLIVLGLIIWRIITSLKR